MLEANKARVKKEVLACTQTAKGHFLQIALGECHKAHQIEREAYMIKYGDGVVSTFNREPLVHCFQAITGDGHIHTEFRELPNKK